MSSISRVERENGIEINSTCATPHCCGLDGGYYCSRLILLQPLRDGAKKFVAIARRKH